MPARTVHPAAPPKPVHVRAQREVRVRWSIGRAALAGHAGAGATDVVLELSATPRPDGWVCTARLIDGDVTTPLDTPPVGVGVSGWTTDAEAGLDHLDLPGFLHATLRGDVVLYARTAMMTTLGVAGGRYETGKT